MEKRIFSILAILFLSGAVFALDCATDADCDGDRKYCSGTKLMHQDWYCSSGVCKYSMGEERCSLDYSHNRVCEGDISYERTGYCDDATLSCKVSKKLIKDCNELDVPLHCDGDVLRSEDYWCNPGEARCRLKDSLEQFCNSYIGERHYCSGTKIMYKWGVCEDRQCKIKSEISKDCSDLDTINCIDNILRKKLKGCSGGYCTTIENSRTNCTEITNKYCQDSNFVQETGLCSVSEASCIMDSTTTDCDSMDEWVGGGDDGVFGDDLACWYKDYSCGATGCEYLQPPTLEEDFDLMDDNNMCYGLRSGEKDYFCMVEQCSGDECQPSFLDYINGCSLDCGAECVLDTQCSSTICDNLDGCYDGIYRDYLEVANTCNECICTSNECSPYFEEPDLDKDGYSPLCGDCNDNDFSINPEAIELPGNDVDENCDGVILCPTTKEWKNHGDFQKCVAKQCNLLLQEGLLTQKQRAQIVKEAAKTRI